MVTSQSEAILKQLASYSGKTEYLSRLTVCNPKKLSFLKVLVCVKNKIGLRLTVQCIYRDVAVYVDLGSFLSL